MRFSRNTPLHLGILALLFFAWPENAQAACENVEKKSAKEAQACMSELNDRLIRLEKWIKDERLKSKRLSAKVDQMVEPRLKRLEDRVEAMVKGENAKVIPLKEN